MRTINLHTALREIAILRVMADRPALHSPDWRNGFDQGANSALVAVEHLLEQLALEQRSGED